MTISDTGTRLDLSFTDSLHKRNVVLTDCYLKLFDRYLEYKCSAIYEADDRHDSDGIWVEIRSNYRWTRLRSDLSQVDMYYDNPQDRWMVSIEFRGVTDPTGWLYNSPKEALKLYNTLQEYMISQL